MKLCDLEINSTKLDDISNSYDLLLIVGEEILEHVVDRAFLANDQPHCFRHVDIVLFILVSFPLLLRLFVNLLFNTIPIFFGSLQKVIGLEEGLVVNPEATILMLHEES